MEDFPINMSLPLHFEKKIYSLSQLPFTIIRLRSISSFLWGWRLGCATGDTLEAVTSCCLSLQKE